ncbi:30S ribosomal protein S1 [Gimesia fumaroli]|jgi:small subunit ribosomal protein S1|uniref:Small ribosomal subunit protein bS1 n=1 Tax=Gimesia fumaroli TaxID=2527976 RepID=A0A518IBL7_9PLAN|nr:30S ribosomal protein S1 [Gimesia fumaroli]QDV50497.1 30S ribosomal protein S1 [Gimesia fumaroli]
MVDRNLIREFNISDEDLDAAFAEVMPEVDADGEETDWVLDDVYASVSCAYDVNQIIDGVVLSVEGEEVLVDIGFKSEGVVHIDEWSEEEEPPKAGDKVQVLLEEVEDEFGLTMLSKRKADRIREWEKVIATHAEGDVVSGTVVRKIKGGLLINIGVNVFLPASQVDIRRPSDIANYIGRTIECVILKIDEARRNIVVSRRKLIEEKREKLKQDLLSKIEEGQIVKGVVKNIADFGAFVDLGGIDGLLHITDMSWGRINHPTEIVKIDDEIEVMILSVDREKEKIALGLKQKSPSPWELVESKYPVGTKVIGHVVNVMSYGAFVKLEDGIEGLVHISEMSWTKRINHPSELVNIGDEVEVVVLGVNKDKQEISLGMKQTQSNPWDEVTKKYPEGAKVKGTVRNLTNYGAFIELEEGVDGLLHVSDMSWTRKISHASEVMKKGDEIECLVISVDEERKRIALGLKQLASDPWETDIPQKYQPGAIVQGVVTKITNFGVFVELEDELEGLLHISELADHKVENPEDIVKVGETLDVKILRVDTDDRKIGLSRKLEEPIEEEVSGEAGEPATAGAPRKELMGGTGGNAPLFSMPSETSESSEEAPAEEPAAEEKAEESAE